MSSKPFNSLLKMNSAGNSSQSSNESIYSNQQVNYEEKEDVFLDTLDDFFINTPNFEEAILDTRRAFAIFFNNDIDEAIRVCEKWKDVSPIHAFTNCCINTFLTLLTLEKDNIDNTKKLLKDCEFLLSKIKKQNNFKSYFTSTNYLEYTEEQLYYEVLSAIVDGMTFLVTAFGDQSIVSIIKAIIKLRSANNILNNCENIIKQKGNQWKNNLIKNEFFNAFFLASGTFNLTFSHMPSKVTSILSIIGFGVDGYLGINLLNKSFENKTSLCWPIAGAIIIIYYLYAEKIFGNPSTDKCKFINVINEISTRFPNSLFTYLYVGRTNLILGNIEMAKDNFLLIKENNTNFCKSLINVSCWDLIWCYAIMGEFLKAAEVAFYLKDNCFWSPATNQYQAAVFLYCESIKKNDKDLMQKVYKLMKEVPKLRIRYMGRTIPWEKFSVIKSEEFLRKGSLTAPVYELFYIWNVLGFINNNSVYYQAIFNDIDKQLVLHSQNLENHEKPLDEYCLLLCLKAILYRNNLQFLKSIDCLREIFKFENRILNYNYIIPYAYCDLGISYFLNNNLDESKKCLNVAKSNYSGYLAEINVHFKVHNTLTIIKEKELNLSKKFKNKYDAYLDYKNHNQINFNTNFQVKDSIVLNELKNQSFILTRKKSKSESDLISLSKSDNINFKSLLSQKKEDYKTKKSLSNSNSKLFETDTNLINKTKIKKNSIIKRVVSTTKLNLFKNADQDIDKNYSKEKNFKINEKNESKNDLKEKKFFEFKEKDNLIEKQKLKKIKKKFTKLF